MAKRTDKKPIYGDGANIAYMFKNWWNFDKRSFFLYAMMIPPLIVMPILTALIPKLIIDEISGGADLWHMILLIGLMSVLIALITWINPFFDSKSDAVAENINTDYRIRAFKKMMRADYEYIESAEGRLAFEQSKSFTQGWGWGARGFFKAVVDFVSNVIGLFTYTVILTAVDPALIAIVLACGAVNFVSEYFFIKKNNKLNDESRYLHLKTNYIFKTANDYAAGKDVRIYGFRDFFKTASNDVIRGVNKFAARFFGLETAMNGIQILMTAVCEGAAFFYLLKGAVGGELSASDFIFYFALVTGFFVWIFTLTNTLMRIKKISHNCGKYREFVGGNEDEKEGIPLPGKEEFPCGIEFRDVTFTYKGGEEPTVKNMSFKIKPGEKIAVVGENGAGKTTCVKLLCGFYKPQSGRILLNGKDISEFNEKEYFKLFAAVFQDYILLPMSIKKNIALKENDADIDAEKLERVIKEAGLYEKIRALPEGKETKLVKKVFDDAVNLSGGEIQKLLLARALYKDAEILILDEPTAALDPIAENDMYLKYNGFAGNKTSFFISHRLSSTRFCDRIFFIRDGRILEAGTHGELMEKKGAYYKMYEIQSYYYKNGLKNENGAV
ncbi:MAG: ABC transporter ATP-binding protein/permease [Clostridiales bacterium]|jgi:ATP-binding cassette subfamily B protein|nr:ABC transporter ATP-binding protein/permease [Clostridiales bacterium]